MNNDTYHRPRYNLPYMYIFVYKNLVDNAWLLLCIQILCYNDIVISFYCACYFPMLKTIIKFICKSDTDSFCKLHL